MPEWMYGWSDLTLPPKISSKFVNSEISIIGHTDSDGDSLYNMILSEKRAKSIKDYFISKKIKNKISIFGKGESKPAFSNNSKSNKEKNRRVEIFIK